MMAVKGEQGTVNSLASGVANIPVCRWFWGIRRRIWVDTCLFELPSCRDSGCLCRPCRGLGLLARVPLTPGFRFAHPGLSCVAPAGLANEDIWSWVAIW